jgi:hypothetical protein
VPMVMGGLIGGEGIAGVLTCLQGVHPAGLGLFENSW